MEYGSDRDGLFAIGVVSHQQGSWRWQVRGQRVLYRVCSRNDGQQIWYSAEVLSTKVACGNIRDGGKVPDRSLHNRPLTADQQYQASLTQRLNAVERRDVTDYCGQDEADGAACRAMATALAATRRERGKT